MNKQYLKESQYNWEKDTRKLKVNRDGYMIIPDGRCFHCGRIFLNAQIGICFCRDCDKAMSMNSLGIEHDYDSFGPRITVKDLTKSHLPKEQQTKNVNLLSQREIRSPVNFDEEYLYFHRPGSDKEPPHFVTAAGKIIDVDTETEEPEDEYNDRVYRLR